MFSPLIDSLISALRVLPSVGPKSAQRMALYLLEHNREGFVLHGRLSPLDGVGPSDIGLDVLAQRLKDESIQEVIVATNPTVEGEATAHYLAELCKAQGVKISRIAHGVPMGGELEYIDSGTLAHALSSRREL